MKIKIVKYLQRLASALLASALITGLIAQAVPAAAGGRSLAPGNEYEIEMEKAEGFSTLLADASPTCSPQLLRMSDGRMLMTFMGSISGISGDETYPYYSIYDGHAWGMPKLVDGTQPSRDVRAVEYKAYVYFTYVREDGTMKIATYDKKEGKIIDDVEAPLIDIYLRGSGDYAAAVLTDYEYMGSCSDWFFIACKGDAGATKLLFIPIDNNGKLDVLSLYNKTCTDYIGKLGIAEADGDILLTGIDTEAGKTRLKTLNLSKLTYGIENVINVKPDISVIPALDGSGKVFPYKLVCEGEDRYLLWLDSNKANGNSADLYGAAWIGEEQKWGTPVNLTGALETDSRLDSFSFAPLNGETYMAAAYDANRKALIEFELDIHKFSIERSGGSNKITSVDYNCDGCGKRKCVEYKENPGASGTVMIRKFEGFGPEAVIPGKIDGKTVTAVYEFGGDKETVKIIIPETVTDIYGGAFSSLPALKEVRFDGLSGSFVNIGPNAFPDSLEKIYFPAGITDSDVKTAMTLSCFPDGVKLYSGDVPLPHDFSRYDTENGKHWLICAACGEIKQGSTEDCAGTGEYVGVSDTHHRRICKCGLLIDTLHEWNNGEIMRPATETEDGELLLTCTLCGHKSTKAIPATGHTHRWGEWKITIAPTATAEGTAERICGSNAAHKDIIALPELTDNEVWTAGKRVEPTEEKNGSQEYTSIYGKVTVVLPKKDSKPEPPTEPEKPTDPEDPEDPTEPEEPTVPEDPTKPGDANIIKNTNIGVNAPKSDFATVLDELIGAVLTEEEREIAKGGAEIKIILAVEDAGATVSDVDKAAVEAAIKELDGYKLGQYLDVSLIKTIGDESQKISRTYQPISITFEIPKELRGDGRTYAVIRVHNGKADVLNDTDSVSDTVTVDTDLFSTYAIVFYDGAADTPEPPVATGVKTFAGICAALGAGALIMFMLVYFTTGRNGLSEEKKKRLSSGLVEWGKKGGRLRFGVALALIFLILFFYYCIGRKTSEDCRTV